MCWHDLTLSSYNVKYNPPAGRVSAAPDGTGRYVHVRTCNLQRSGHKEAKTKKEKRINLNSRFICFCVGNRKTTQNKFPVLK